MRRLPTRFAIAAFSLGVIGSTGCAHQSALAARSAAAQPWAFAVSGDSRNCGNIVMPAIAAGARVDHAAFYWHLGDLRAIYKVDEDYAREQRFKAFAPPPSLNDYVHTAWTDFSQHQVQPFAAMPFFIGIGNHETIAPKTRGQFLIEFQSLLDRPELQRQRELDGGLMSRIGQVASPRTYYHWVERGVDFINLDNASNDAFDAAQLAWFDAIVDADRSDPAIRTLVVGMHESLPYSLSDGHSMCGSASGRESGVHVYETLAALRNAKHVYVLASHSHYYLAGNFATEHWRSRDRVLPGWVIGTAGAERYALPTDVNAGPDAREHVYGYLLGTVKPDGVIEFAFRELGEPELQGARSSDYTADDVRYCVALNPDPEKLRANRPQPVSCESVSTR